MFIAKGYRHRGSAIWLYLWGLVVPRAELGLGEEVPARWKRVHLEAEFSRNMRIWRVRERPTQRSAQEPEDGPKCLSMGHPYCYQRWKGGQRNNFSVS